MEASQPTYRAGALCRDLASSLIPIQNLISVHMTRRAGPLSEIPLGSGEISVGGMKISPYEHSIPATETKMLLLLMRCVSKQWARVSFLTRVKFLSRQAGWNFSI